MKLKPLQYWAVIKITNPTEKSAGGIIIPDSARERPAEGIIIAIGPGRYKTEKKDKGKKEKEKKRTFVPTVLKTGQRVIFMDYMTRDVDVGEETITVVREEDILGFFEETPLAVKKSFEIEEKKDRPVVVKAKAEIVPAAAARPAITGKKTAKPAAKNRAGSPKPAAAKKTSKAKPAKKTTPRKAAQKKVSKPKKKGAAPQKAKPAVKKPAAKKTAAKKVSPKKSSLKTAARKGRTGTKKKTR